MDRIKKSSLKMTAFIIVLFVVILITGFIMYEAVKGGRTASATLACKKTCRDHNDTYIKVDTNIIFDSVCECKKSTFPII